MPAEPAPNPVSASRLAELLRHQLPAADTISPEAFELVERVRELMDAVVLTDVEPQARAAAAAHIAEITRQLSAQQREHHLFMVRHPDGRIESLTQAGSGPAQPAEPAAGMDPPPDRAAARHRAEPR